MRRMRHLINSVKGKKTRARSLFAFTFGIMSKCSLRDVARLLSSSYPDIEEAQILLKLVWIIAWKNVFIAIEAKHNIELKPLRFVVSKTVDLRFVSWSISIFQLVDIVKRFLQRSEVVIVWKCTAQANGKGFKFIDLRCQLLGRSLSKIADIFVCSPLCPGRRCLSQLHINKRPYQWLAES